MAEPTAPLRLSNWIGGVPCSPVAGEHFENLNPATSELLCEVPRSSAADVERAVEAAREGAKTWGAVSVPERAQLLDRVADLIEARAESLATLESRDQGKPRSLAARIDIPRAAANFRFFAGALRHQSPGAWPMPGALNYAHRAPVGICGLITPWNLPLYLLTWKVAPALAMGNAIIAKPSELTPMTADALAAILSEAGLPAGTFSLLQGYGREAGAAMVAHPEIKAISFTGGTLTGKEVARVAAPMFKKLSLELGGKNATVIFGDADLEEAVAGAARAGFTNQGEICLCGSRILVQDSLYDAFLSRLVERVRELRVGDPLAADTEVGALNSLAHREKVESYLRLAREEGGQVLCGGSRPDLPAPHDQGAFLKPAVISGLGQSCRVVQEEIFGPVVTVQPFRDEAEALSLANGVPYGLSASVWTRDLSRAHRFAQALDVGMVWVNTWLLRDLRAPFGGTKASGVGREGGRWSLEFYSETRNICVRI